MRARIEADPEREPVPIPAGVLNEICVHAREAYPDQECCGLVTGDEGERYRRAWPCRNEQDRYHRSDPLAHPRDARTAFSMHPNDYLEIEKRAAERGERVTAVYHSHLDCGAWFSEHDQAFAEQDRFPFPEADHVVVSVVGDRSDDGQVRAHRIAEANVFRRDPESGRFVGARAKPTPP